MSHNSQTDIAIRRVSHLLTTWESDAERYQHQLVDFGLEVLEPPMISSGEVNHRGELDTLRRHRRPETLEASASSPAARAWVNRSEYADFGEDDDHDAVQQRNDENNRRTRTPPPPSVEPFSRQRGREQFQQQQPQPQRGPVLYPQRKPPVTPRSTRTQHQQHPPPSPHPQTTSLERISPFRAGSLLSMKQQHQQHQSEHRPQEHDHHDHYSRRTAAAGLVTHLVEQGVQEIQTGRRGANNTPKRPMAATTPRVTAKTPSVLAGFKLEEPEPEPSQWWRQDEEDEQRKRQQQQQSARVESDAEAEEAFKHKPKIRPQSAEEVATRVLLHDPQSTGRFMKGRPPPPPQPTATTTMTPPPTSSRAALRLIDGQDRVFLRHQQQERERKQQGVRFMQQNESGRLVAALNNSNNSSKMPDWLREQYNKMWQQKQQQKNKQQRSQDQARNHHVDPAVVAVEESEHPDQLESTQRQHAHDDDDIEEQHQEQEQRDDEFNYDESYHRHHQQLSSVDDNSQRAFQQRNATAVSSWEEFQRLEQKQEEKLIAQQQRCKGINESNSSATILATAATTPKRFSYQTALGRRFGEMPLSAAQEQERARLQQEKNDRDQQLRQQRMVQADSGRAAMQRQGARREQMNFESRLTVDNFWSGEVSRGGGKAFDISNGNNSNDQADDGDGTSTSPAAQATMQHHKVDPSRMFSRTSGGDGGGGTESVVITQRIENTGPPPVVHFVSPLGKSMKVPSSSSWQGDQAVRGFLGDLNQAAPDTTSRRMGTGADSLVTLETSGSNNNNNSRLTHAMLHDLHHERWDAVPDAQQRTDNAETTTLSGVTRHSQLQWRDSLRDNTRSHVRTPFSSAATPMLEVDTTLHTMAMPAPIDKHGRVVGAPSSIQNEIHGLNASASGSTLGAPTAMISAATSMQPLSPITPAGKLSQQYQKRQESLMKETSNSSFNLNQQQQQQSQFDDNTAALSGSFTGGVFGDPRGPPPANAAGGNNSRSSSTMSRDEWLQRKKQLWRERASKKREEEMRLQEELRAEQQRKSNVPQALRDITNNNPNTSMTSLSGRESFASPLIGGRLKGMRRRPATPGDKYRVAVAALEKVCEENERNAALLAETEAATAKQRAAAAEEAKRRKAAASGVSVVSAPTIITVAASTNSEDGGGGGGGDNTTNNSQQQLLRRRSSLKRPNVQFSGGGAGDGEEGSLRLEASTSGANWEQQQNQHHQGRQSQQPHHRSASAALLDGAETSSVVSGMTTGTFMTTTALTTASGASPRGGGGAAGGGGGGGGRHAHRNELAFERAQLYAAEKPVPAADVRRVSDQRLHHAVMSPKKVAQFLPANFTLLADPPQHHEPTRVAGGETATDIVAARAVTRAVKAAALDEERRRQHKDQTPAWMLSAAQEDEKAERERQERTSWTGENARELDAAAAVAARRRQPWAAFRDPTRDAPARKVFGTSSSVSAARSVSGSRR